MRSYSIFFSSVNGSSLPKETKYVTEAIIRPYSAILENKTVKRKREYSEEFPSRKKISQGMFDTKDFKIFEKKYFEDYNETLSKAPLLLAADLCKINYFFHQLPLVKKGLSKLEAEIGEKLLQKNISLESFVSDLDIDNYKCYKSLSESLKQWLINSDFSHQIIILSSELSKKDFFYLLKNKNMFKDVGIDPFHGEWSHFIQWYLIANNEDLVKNLNFLPHVIIEMMGNTKNNNKQSLWEITFDSFKEESIFNFTSPENVTSFLKSSSSDFPLLSTNIQKRFLKRVKNGENIKESDFESDSDDISEDNSNSDFNNTI
ncbi:helicase [Legionella santicrucis]|uniref:Helicase n=1 Tax=Legionella santicrucis TaxID=45074 RepID=A0A0W0ZBF5_9GAMM|nr:LirA/MavJ family T4SS effector [Legionella santicrucis]KTD66492.1 helicase [Legionella santicrucis]